MRSQNVEVFHINDHEKVIAFRRPGPDGESGDTVVLINFSAKNWKDYRIGFPSVGKWSVRIDTSSSYYADDGENNGVGSIEANLAPYDYYRFSASMPLPAYAAIVLSKDV